MGKRNSSRAWNADSCQANASKERPRCGTADNRFGSHILIGFFIPNRATSLDLLIPLFLLQLHSSLSSGVLHDDSLSYGDIVATAADPSEAAPRICEGITKRTDHIFISQGRERDDITSLWIFSVDAEKTSLWISTAMFSFILFIFLDLFLRAPLQFGTERHRGFNSCANICQRWQWRELLPKSSIFFFRFLRVRFTFWNDFKRITWSFRVTGFGNSSVHWHPDVVVCTWRNANQRQGAFLSSET